MANITFTYGEIESAATQLGAGRQEIVEKLQGMQRQNIFENRSGRWGYIASPETSSAGFRQ